MSKSLVAECDRDLIAQTARLLGCRAVTAKVGERVSESIKACIEVGRLPVDSDGILREAEK